MSTTISTKKCTRKTYISQDYKIPSRFFQKKNWTYRNLMFVINWTRPFRMTLMATRMLKKIFKINQVCRLRTISLKYLNNDLLNCKAEQCFKFLNSAMPGWSLVQDWKLFFKVQALVSSTLTLWAQIWQSSFYSTIL